MPQTLQTIHSFILNELHHFEEAHEESLRIIEHFFGIRRYEILAQSQKKLPEDKIILCQELVRQRKTGKPLAHLLGYFYFYKDKFPVSPETLIPRYDTEHMITEAIKHKPKKIIDIGTGTGVIAFSLARELPKAEITAVDIVAQPFQASAEALGIKNVSFFSLNFLDKTTWKHLGLYDLIISNPPYLDEDDMKKLSPSVKDWEPASALYGGKDGMIFYRALEEFCSSHLAKEGLCIVEVDHKYEPVKKIFSKYHCTITKDYAGLTRVLKVEKQPR